MPSPGSTKSPQSETTGCAAAYTTRCPTSLSSPGSPATAAAARVRAQGRGPEEGPGGPAGALAASTGGRRLSGKADGFVKEVFGNDKPNGVLGAFRGFLGLSEAHFSQGCVSQVIFWGHWPILTQPRQLRFSRGWGHRGELAPPSVLPNPVTRHLPGVGGGRSALQNPSTMQIPEFSTTSPY